MASIPPALTSPARPYDPARLDAALRGAGFAGHRRFWGLLGMACGLGWRLWAASRKPPGPAREAAWRQDAVWLRERFIHFGATFIKIGQLLSTRPDLLPKPYVDEMALLQDRVPPFEWEIARRLLTQELGRAPESAFAVFNPLPIAAASIGQAYRAERHDGRDVVVKLQRPGLLPTVDLDLAILRRLTRFLDRHPRLGRGMPYTAILDEFGRSMYEQADYRTEGAYAERFKANFRDFPGVDAPRIHWDLTTEKVLTMDFVDGMKVTDLVALKHAGVRFEDVVRTGVRATIKQLLEDGFFHADLHPGNLFVKADGTLVYIDFGMAGELSDFVQEKLVDILLHSVHRQYRELVEDFIALDFLSPAVERSALVPVAERIFTAQYGEAGERLSVKEIFAAVSAVLYEHPFRIPERIAFILRNLIALEGIIHQLWPDFKFLEVASPYAAKILLTDAKASIREKLVDELFVDGRFMPERLSKLFGTATQEPTFRFGEVAPAVLRYLASPAGGRVRDGLFETWQRGALGGTDFAWRGYLDLAAIDPSWTLDDLLVPVFDFLQTDEGVMFALRLVEARNWAAGAAAEGPSLAAIAGVLTGRRLSAPGLESALGALESVLGRPEIPLQSFVEKAAALLASDTGARWFYALGEGLGGAPGSSALIGRRLAGVLRAAASHPYLDLTPLAIAVLQRLKSPDAKAWQQFIAAGGGTADGEVIGALRTLFVQGRVHWNEVLGPALSLLVSGEGGPLRQELLETVRQRVGVPIASAAQGLMRQAGEAWRAWRGAQAEG